MMNVKRCILCHNKIGMFTTGQIITAATGKLCCLVGDVYKILNFLTGDNLFTHQLPRAGRVCEPWIRKQQPWLNELDMTACTPETWLKWLAKAEKKYGKHHELKPLPDGEWQSSSPITEAVEIMGRKTPITVVTK